MIKLFLFYRQHNDHRKKFIH